MFSPSSAIFDLTRSSIVWSGFLMKACSSRQTVLKNLSSFPSTILFTTFSGFPLTCALDLALGFDEIARNISATDVKRMRSSDVQRNVLYEFAKILVPCHKVGLAVHFHEHTDFPLQVNVRGHNAFLRHARGLFTCGGDSFRSQNRLCLFEISAAVRECTFAIHKARAGLFAQLLNQLWIDFGCCFHERLSVPGER